MPDLFQPLTLKRGPAWKHRIALAPLTNRQSHKDGTLSDDDFRWLTMRAEGGFALTMTCATQAQEGGRGYEGQPGIFSDRHIVGLSRLADAIRKAGSVSSVQLHHAGMRASVEPVSPSDDAATGARGLTLDEVERVRDDFVLAAQRAEQAGFDGVELHGAHGYLLCGFLSPTLNRRSDRYGGPLENRMRLIQEIVTGIRQSCRADFQLGLRLSPERYGQMLEESIAVAGHFLAAGEIDYLDMSLWDVNKEPEDEAFRGRTLMSCFTGLPRGDVRLGVAGAVRNGEVARQCVEEGADFVFAGKAAILKHDLPRQLLRDRDYHPPAMPVSAEYLAGEGLSPVFINYLKEAFKGVIA